MVAAVVLAAGAARRFGAQKLLAPLAGATVVRCAVERVLAARLDDVVVVLGREADGVRQGLEGLPLRTVVNPRFGEGLGTSLAAGIGALAPACDAALVALGDQPAVSPAVIDALVSRWRAQRTAIVAPRYRGQRGNPVLFDRTLFAELCAVRGDIGARELIARSAERLALIDVDDEMPVDVDTPDGLAAAARQLAREPDAGTGGAREAKPGRATPRTGG